MPQLSRICRGKLPDAYCPIPTLCQDQETWAFDLGEGIFCSSLLFLSFHHENLNGVDGSPRLGQKDEEQVREERLGFNIATIWEEAS